MKKQHWRGGLDIPHTSFIPFKPQDEFRLKPSYYVKKILIILLQHDENVKKILEKRVEEFKHQYSDVNIVQVISYIAKNYKEEMDFIKNLINHAKVDKNLKKHLLEELKKVEKREHRNNKFEGYVIS